MKEAGLTKGAVYHHFLTKEELYMSMMLHTLDDVRTQTFESIESTRGQPINERLLHSLARFLDLPNETIATIQLVRRDNNIFLPSDRKELIDTYQSALPNPLQTIFDDAMAEGEIIQADTRLLSRQFIAVVEVSLNYYERKDLGSAETLANFIVANLMNGIRQ